MRFIAIVAVLTVAFIATANHHVAGLDAGSSMTPIVIPSLSPAQPPHIDNPGSFKVAQGLTGAPKAPECKRDGSQCVRDTQCCSRRCKTYYKAGPGGPSKRCGF